MKRLLVYLLALLLLSPAINAAPKPVTKSAVSVLKESKENVFGKKKPKKMKGKKLKPAKKPARKH